MLYNSDVDRYKYLRDYYLFVPNCIPASTVRNTPHAGCQPCMCRLSLLFLVSREGCCEDKGLLQRDVLTHAYVQQILL